MAETYIQMFQETFYPEIFAVTAENTIRKFAVHKEQIAEDWKRTLRQYMEQLAQKQKEGQAAPVREMNLSFLFTSMGKKPVFRVDSYPEGGRAFSESILTCRVRADWMVSELEEFGEALLAKAREEKLQRYIRAAEAEALKLRATRSLLYYFALRFKYMVPEILDMRSLAKLEKAQTFTLQMGEYMDWQKTIYAVLPQVDIFHCDRKTDLRFRNFPAIYYEKKEFADLNISQSKFLDCTFTESSLVNTRMDDCTFDGCLFENVRLKDMQMAGCLFIRCTFRKTVFENVVFVKDGTEEEEPDYFEPAEFYECTFTDSSFAHCKLERCFVTDCEANGLELSDCRADGSGFAEMNHIVWKRDGEAQDGIL